MCGAPTSNCSPANLDDVHFTRVTDLLLAGLVGLGFGYLIFQLASEQVPKLPVLAGGTLAVLAAVDAALAVWVRRRVSTGRLTQAILVSRCVVLAKASSMLGALMLGGWLGVLIYLVPKSGVVAEAEVPSAIVGAICAALLIAAGLWLEHSCRTPEDQDHDQTGETLRRPEN